MANISARSEEVATFEALTVPEAYSYGPTTSPQLVDSTTERSERVAGIRINKLDFDGVLDAIVDHIESAGPPGYVVTPNAQHVVLYQTDALLRETYDRALLTVPDGVPLLWAAKLMGAPLSGRVNGTDLMESLCERAAQHGLRVYLLGGREGAAAAAVTRLLARYPELVVCGTYCPPFGFEDDPVENVKIIASIRAAHPHILFVGLGAPKQEYWMFRHHQQLAVPVSLGVGGSFEFVGGIMARAPRWMQRWGLEWLHRLVSEPKRLWKRYVFGNALFCVLMMWHYAARNFAPPRPQNPGLTPTAKRS